MEDKEFTNDNYQRIEKAIHYIVQNNSSGLKLSEVAKFIGLSEFHFQRLFLKWAGITPKKFSQFLALNQAKSFLDQNKDLMLSSFEAGLSGPGRLHDLFVKLEAMSPGEYKLKGKGLLIHFGFHPSPFGPVLLGVTSRGICYLSFVPDGRKKQALIDLKEKWANANFEQDQNGTKKLAEKIFSKNLNDKKPVNLLIRGPAFRVKVWEALLKIPAGSVLSYHQLAKLIGSPGAARAVGTAMSENIIAFLIPCHRVIKTTGAIGEYRWGSCLKQTLLVYEQINKV
jgi:AraC family transcriptional regulator, regulatory protein of adaptative response / methylated-DNA-[protein]-cysteine methyltransferase